MVTLNLPIIQQLLGFCNISDKNEFTADILFVANKYSRRNNIFLTRATFHLFDFSKIVPDVQNVAFLK
jgi:hypothetical protein